MPDADVINADASIRADGGPLPAMKVARHDGGIATTVGTRSGTIDPAGRELVPASHSTVICPGAVR